jgi:phosphoglycolate phosphatase
VTARPPIRAVVFDLDGTLADTLADIGAAMDRALQTLGMPPHPLQAYREFVGKGAENLVRRSLPPDREALVPLALAEFRRQYGAHLVDRTTLYPGIAELLDQLVARDVGLGVLSNKPDGFTRGIIDTLFSRWRFGPVFGEREGVPKKPDPTSALEVARGLGVAPSACALVGDTAIDLRTAQNAAMFGVGVTWGFRDEAELVCAGADALIHAPAELLAVLEFARAAG